MSRRASGNLLVIDERGEPRGAVTVIPADKNVGLLVPRQGWYLGRIFNADGGEMVFQLCAPDYPGMRQLLMQYEPALVKRACRGPDTRDAGKPRLNIAFIDPGAAPPVGHTEIMPDTSIAEFSVPRNVECELVALAEANGYDRVFSAMGWVGEMSEFYGAPPNRD